MTKQIIGLMERASSEKDYLSHDLLEWFMREQLEEVSSTDMLLKMVKEAANRDSCSWRTRSQPAAGSVSASRRSSSCR